MAAINGGSGTCDPNDPYSDSTLCCYPTHNTLCATYTCPPSPTSAQAGCGGGGDTGTYTVGGCSNNSCVTCTGTFTCDCTQTQTYRCTSFANGC